MGSAVPSPEVSAKNFYHQMEPIDPRTGCGPRVMFKRESLAGFGGRYPEKAQCWESSDDDSAVGVPTDEDSFSSSDGESSDSDSLDDDSSDSDYSDVDSSDGYSSDDGSSDDGSSDSDSSDGNSSEREFSRRYFNPNM